MKPLTTGPEPTGIYIARFRNEYDETCVYAFPAQDVIEAMKHLVDRGVNDPNVSVEITLADPDDVKDCTVLHPDLILTEAPS